MGRQAGFSVILIPLLLFYFISSAFLIYLLIRSRSEVARKEIHFAVRKEQFTDEEVTKMVYSSSKVPEGFLKEEATDPIIYETTASIKSASEKIGGVTQLCTDSRATARELSDLASRYTSAQRDYESDRQTEKYFEFKRQKGKDVILSRIHKCSYFNPQDASVAKDGLSGTLGVFNFPQVSLYRAKELVEYLWFTQNYNRPEAVVLSSFTDDSIDVISPTIYEANLASGGFGDCDKVSLFKKKFRLDKDNGELTFKTELVREIRGRCNTNPFNYQVDN